MLTIILTLVCLLLFAGFIVSVIKNLEQMSEIDDVADVVKVCLVELHFIHDRIETKTKLEVLSDDPIVRELLSDIKDARDIMWSINEKLEPISRLGDEETDEKEDKEES